MFFDTFRNMNIIKKIFIKEPIVAISVLLMISSRIFNYFRSDYVIHCKKIYLEKIQLYSSDFTARFVCYFKVMTHLFVINGWLKLKRFC